MPARYPCGGVKRREFLGAAALSAGAPLLAGAAIASAQEPKTTRAVGSPRPEGALGVPGPYPGRVYEVRHPGIIREGVRDRRAIKAALDKGLTSLTGAPHAVDAWRKFVSPGERVGIKVVPNGHPGAPTSHELVLSVIDGLASAGIKLKDMVVFDRYRREFMEAKYQDILPAGVVWGGLTPEWDEKQTTLTFDGGDQVSGYDPDEFVHLALVTRNQDPADDRNFRSHLGRIVTRSLDKIICLPCLKDHHAAGVTGALKNMSHGLFNNVFRSHSAPDAVAMCAYIPAVVSHPVVRRKCVLQIMDASRGVWEGGPFGREKDAAWRWDHGSLLFATDPVAMDRVEWDILDKKRASMGYPGLGAIGRLAADPFKEGDKPHEMFDIRQPQYIAIAGQVGLGNFDWKSPRGRSRQINYRLINIS